MDSERSGVDSLCGSGGSFRSSGRVVGVDSGGVVVRLVRMEACQGCRVKGGCGVSRLTGESGSASDYYVLTDRAGEYCVGDRVGVEISRGSGFRAVLYAYVYPFLLLLLPVIVMGVAGVSGGLIFLTVLAVLGIYFLLLFRFRSRLESSLSVRLSPSDDGALLEEGYGSGKAFEDRTVGAE